ncbi:hypothetical protein LINPERPRIM_LOCUS37406 [Linum perenne]
MDNSAEKMMMLMRYKYHIAVAAMACVVLPMMLYAAPRLITILAYFWPLLASTAVFLVLIMGFGGVSRLATDHQLGDRSPGEGILDYVTGRPDYYTYDH